MLIVFGGAYNGKRRYVNELLSGCRASWHERELPAASGQLTVVASLDQWVKKQLSAGANEEAILQCIESFLTRQPKEKLIWILTDINRGIVPADALERQVRDVTGRLYQLLFKEADQIVRIWYGIPQTVKGEENHENLYTNR